MSEYQYYEFLAIDRPLNKEQMAKLRAISTRATITSTRFQNVYNWGDFKGNPLKLMEEYFDAFVYVSNWGTRRFMIRLPRQLLSPETRSLYCACDLFDAKLTDGFVILEFLFNNEEGGDWEEGEGWMESLAPIRAEIASGDLRALYLGWLLCADAGYLDDDTVEPPVPPGLAALSEPLQALVDFLNIDEELIAVAAERSGVLRDMAPSRLEMEQWIRGLPIFEKDSLLLRLIEGEAPILRAELLQRFWRSREPVEGLEPRSGGRTVVELISAAKERAEQRRLEEERRQAEEQARLERERAAARAKYLDSLVGREEQLWQQAESLIAAKRPKEYDQAVELLKDLRDLAARAGASEDFDGRLARLRAQHFGKPSFIDRLNRAL